MFIVHVTIKEVGISPGHFPLWVTCSMGGGGATVRIPLEAKWIAGDPSLVFASGGVCRWGKTQDFPFREKGRKIIQFYLYQIMFLCSF